MKLFDSIHHVISRHIMKLFDTDIDMENQPQYVSSENERVAVWLGLSTFLTVVQSVGRYVLRRYGMLNIITSKTGTSFVAVSLIGFVIIWWQIPDEIKILSRTIDILYIVLIGILINVMYSTIPLFDYYEIIGTFIAHLLGWCYIVKYSDVNHMIDSWTNVNPVAVVNSWRQSSG